MSAHTAWGQMIARCYDQSNHKYPSYGGRGIRVCDRWICRKNFLADMGERPAGKTLNRIDNDGHYSPENCEWSTATEQAQNRRDNRNLTYREQTKPLTAWAREYGIRRETLRRRLDNGWTMEKALTVPVSPNNHNLENTHADCDI